MSEKAVTASGSGARPAAASAAADGVGAIIAAAEASAKKIRLAAEQRSRDRIAEGERAAQNRIKAAEEEAAEIVALAGEQANRRLEETEALSRELLRGARISASDVRTEGLELVGNLRDTGDSLRSNAERLLRDVQGIHSRMVAQLDRVDGGASRNPPPRRQPSASRASRDRDLPQAPSDGEVLDVPEFIPPS